MSAGFDIEFNVFDLSKTNKVKEAPLFTKDVQMDAQHSFRYVMKVGGVPEAYIFDVTRPSYKVETKKRKLLGYNINYPTNIEWSPISFSVREIHTSERFGTVSSNLMAKLKGISYKYPRELTAEHSHNISKNNLNISLGNIEILQLMPDGRTKDGWRIYNGIITEVTPSQLSYETDSLTDIKVTVEYDWTEYSHLGLF